MTGEDRLARWPWVVFTVSFLEALTGLVLVALQGDPVADQVMPVIAFSTFGVVGALILARDRRNRIGLVLLWTAATVSFAFVASAAATYSVATDPPRLPATEWLVWAASAVWIVGISPVVFVLPILFPTGTPSNRLWSSILVVDLVALSLAFANAAFGSPTFEWDGWTTDNPLFLSAAAQLPSVEDSGALFLAVAVTGVAALIARYRGAGDEERLQIRWLAFAVALLFVYLTFSEVTPFAERFPLADSILSGLGFLGLPVAIGVAVLRYRLYDLDLVVKKTLLYATLVGLATAVYAAIVVGLGTWVGSESSFFTVVAAVVIAVGFNPARVRLTRLVDRVVYGRRATPYEVLSAFSERIGDAYASDDMLPRMARVLAEGTGAERADVWLKVGDRLRIRATWPAGGADGRTAPPDDSAYEVSYPVRHQGEMLGALSIRKAPADPVRPAEDKLVRDLAGQAGLVLRNQQLTARLEVQVEELRALQKRLVAAQDEERRRLERNIHDGAQQQLVALAVKARLARTLTERDAAKAAQMLEQIEAETQTALEDLRDLARGIYPPLLADKGLVVAVEAQARKATFPVTVRAEGVERVPREIEAAIYFSVLEALQNAAKYADASRVEVELAQREDALTFRVSDDGRGFDPASTGAGTGLQGIADRLGALDGRLEIASVPGAGTHLTGTVPV